MKKARRWLEASGVTCTFHDFRVDGLEPAQLQKWARAVGWETLLNRRGTTWRQLSEGERADVDEAKALKLMLAHPALIKRPVLEHADKVHVGFAESEYETLFKG